MDSEMLWRQMERNKLLNLTALYPARRLQHRLKHAIGRDVAGPYFVGMANNVFIAPGRDLLVEARAGRLRRNEERAILR